MKHINNFNTFLNEGRVKKDEKIDIYRDKDFIVVAPISFQASCKYGAYSKWCISAPSNDDIWTDDINTPNATTKIVFIIQRNLEYSESEQEDIYKFEKYHEKQEDGEELSEEEREEYIELSDSMRGYDFSKIALIKSIKNNGVEIWDMNNIHVNDPYSSPNPNMKIEDLPISDIVIEKAYDYLMTK
jgi:hypothetical protein